MKNKTYKRSSSSSLKNANQNKTISLKDLYVEYNRLLNVFISYFWSQDLGSLRKYCGAAVYNLFPTILGSFMKQCAAKQALGIVRSVFGKQKKRLFAYKCLLAEGQRKKAKKLKRVIDEVNLTCPTLKELIPMELGGNRSALRVNLDDGTSFDGWLTLSYEKIVVPFRKTKHMNKLARNDGILKLGCRLTDTMITLSYDFEKKEKTVGTTIGVDIGSLNVLTCSDGFQTGKDTHGHDLNSIQKKLARKKKGSKAFSRAQAHRDNYVNWSVNQWNLSGVKEVRREDIKNMGKGQKKSRFLQAFTYAGIFDKMDRYCEEQNVSVVKVPPAYTSQRCSACGWTRSTNRKGKVFECTSCGHTEDADANAARNISIVLRPIEPEERRLKKNLIGFYWGGQEFIVPVVQRK
jgi:putative transposase